MKPLRFNRDMPNVGNTAEGIVFYARVGGGASVNIPGKYEAKVLDKGKAVKKTFTLGNPVIAPGTAGATQLPYYEGFLFDHGVQTLQVEENSELDVHLRNYQLCANSDQYRIDTGHTEEDRENLVPVNADYALYVRFRPSEVIAHKILKRTIIANAYRLLEEKIGVVADGGDDVVWKEGGKEKVVSLSFAVANKLGTTSSTDPLDCYDFVSNQAQNSGEAAQIVYDTLSDADIDYEGLYAQLIQSGKLTTKGVVVELQGAPQGNKKSVITKMKSDPTYLEMLKGLLK